jgi:hypothetical protein
MPSDVPQPPKKRQNPTNVIALLIVLGVIFVALWIVFTLLSDVFNAAKEGYAAAGTSPGSGGPPGSFTSPGRVVS